MKVLVCTQMFPEDPGSAVISGMIKNPYYQTIAVSEAGVDIEVITTGVKKWHKTIRNINVKSIGDAPLKGVLRAFIYEIKMSFSCIRALSRFKPELIHIHHLNLPLISILKRFGIIKAKLIYTAHGTSTPELKAAVQGSRLKYNLLRINGHVQHWIDIFCWHQADYLLSPSAYQISEMEDLYSIDRDKVEVVYNGYDSKEYYPSNSLREKYRAKFGVKHDDKLVVFVGRAAKKKGLEYLIQVMDELHSSEPNIRLLIVLGYMGRQTEYRDMIKALSESRNYIIYKESMPESDMGGVYNSADLCVFPSIGYESIPTVIYEAMGCGKPIVTQGAWGVREVLGATYISEDSIVNAEFTSVLSDLLDNKVALTEQGNANYIKSKAFSWEVGGKNLKRLYERVIKGGGDLI